MRWSQTKPPCRGENHLWTNIHYPWTASQASNLSLKREFTSIERHLLFSFLSSPRHATSQSSFKLHSCQCVAWRHHATKYILEWASPSWSRGQNSGRCAILPMGKVIWGRDFCLVWAMLPLILTLTQKVETMLLKRSSKTALVCPFLTEWIAWSLLKDEEMGQGMPKLSFSGQFYTINIIKF